MLVKRGWKRAFASAILFAALANAVEAPPPVVPHAIYSLSAAELRGDLSFLASNVLQGRYTPSPGLEVAAEFIASQFRQAGLQPAGDDDFFQTAHMVDRTLAKFASGLTVEDGAQSFKIAADSAAVLQVTAAAHVEHAPILRIAEMNAALLNGVDLSGKAIVVRRPDFRGMTHEKAMAAYSGMQKFQAIVLHSKAALEVVAVKHLDAPSSQLRPASEGSTNEVPCIGVVEAAADKLGAAGQAATLSAEIPAPHDERVTVKNVIGILPGSEPSLKNTYVLVTAHYDHIGTTETAGRLANPESTPNPNDHIYNGANDDGSGTVSVIEIARALAQVHARPKRTMVFITFFGEERGELGSEYYVAHPVFPIAKTVADINLEQVGRTDELDSGKTVKRINSLSATGYDYSDVTGYLIRAGKQLGTHVYKDDQASDAYFRQSDNAAFADSGVPAHSVTVAFDYADYHGLGDEWQKIDYNNMARVDRAIALAALNIANAVNAPRWSVANSKTAPFREAQSKQSAVNP